MGATPIFTPEQVAFIRQKYMTTSGRSRIADVVSLVNNKWPELGVLKSQIHNIARDRGWTVVRKAARAKIKNVETALSEATEDSRLALKALVEKHRRIGAKIVAKGEGFVDTAGSAKTLSSAASAVKTGITIERDSFGLGTTTHVSHVSITASFSRSPQSPFMRKVEQVVEGEVVEVVA